MFIATACIDELSLQVAYPFASRNVVTISGWESFSAVTRRKVLRAKIRVSL